MRILSRADGWSHWYLFPPQSEHIKPCNTILISREEWPAENCTRLKDVPPEMNSIGLYWKPSGITREILRDMGVEA